MALLSFLILITTSCGNPSLDDLSDTYSYDKTVVGSSASHNYKNICEVTDKYPDIIIGKVTKIEGFSDREGRPRTNLYVVGNKLSDPDSSNEVKFTFLTSGGPLPNGEGIQMWPYEVEVEKQYIFFSKTDNNGVHHLFEFAVMSKTNCSPTSFGDNGIYKNITVEDMINQFLTCDNRRLDSYEKSSDNVECPDDDNDYSIDSSNRE